MSYREYVPTCVETLFGRPPTKFKARAIIPESKTINLDGGRYRGCACEKHNSPKIILREQEDFQRNGPRYKCILNCPDCRKYSKRNEEIVPFHEEAIEKRRSKGRRQNRRGDHDECCCAHQCDYTDEEYYPEERTRTKHKGIIKQSNYCSEPSRSTDLTDHYGGERYCHVCKVWITSNSKEKRDEYSSKRYEDRDAAEDSNERKGAPSSRNYRFVVECCKFCGSHRELPSESDEKGEDNCVALQDFVETQGICALAEHVEQCSRSEDFYGVNNLGEPLIGSNDEEKDRDSCDEIFEKYAAEMAALERYPETPKDEDSNEHNSQEDVLGANREHSSKRGFRKAHSTGEVSSNEKQYKNKSEDLEVYKEHPMTELKDESHEKSPQNSEFRSCNCEYARRDWKAEEQKKVEPDKNEIRIIMKKCDEALGQLELFKKEIAKNNKEKCHCDLNSTMDAVREFKQRCSQLEKQVGYLQRCIDCYALTNIKNRESQGKRDVQHLQKKTSEYKKTQGRRFPDNSRKRDQDFRKEQEVITTSVKVSKKPHSTCAPVRVRNIRCEHIKCFPPDEISRIESFKMCPVYEEIVQRKSNKR